MSIVDIIFKYQSAYIEGFKNTLILSVYIWCIGISIGALFGALSVKYQNTFGVLLKVMLLTVSSVPAIVLLFWAHYPFQAAFKVTINPMYTSIIVLSIINIIGVASIVRSVIEEFPGQYVIAAEVLGVKKSLILIKIYYPLVLRGVMPGILILEVTMLQSTIFASLISVDELFRVTQRINSQIYQPISLYSILGVIYMILSMPIYILSNKMSKKYKAMLSDK